MKKKLLKAGIMITVISSMGKMLGLLRESTLASYFGMSRDTDAFKIAFSIPDIFVSIICAAIVQIFVPIYSDILRENDADRTKRFLNSTYTVVGLLSLVITILGAVCCRVLIKTIAPGFDAETLNKTVTLSLIIFPGVIFYVLGSLTASHLQVHGRFIASSLIWFSYNIFIIISLVLFNRFGIECAAFGALAGLIGMLLIQLPVLKKEGYRFGFCLDFQDGGLKQIGIAIIPVILASAFNQIYNIINRRMASGLDEGSISAMDFSYKVAMIIYGVFVVSLITVIYPSMADKSNDADEFKRTVSSNLSLGGIMAVPLVTLVYILRVPVIQVLFQRGSFSRGDTAITAGLLGITVFGVAGITYREILNRAFYSLKDTKTPMINGVTAIALNIVLNLGLVRILGVNGLALGTSISSFVSAAMLYYRLHKKIGGIRLRVIADGLLKPLFAALIMGAVLLLNDHLLRGFAIMGEGLLASLIKLAAYSILGILVYTFVIFQLNIQELNVFKEKFMVRLTNKGRLMKGAEQ